MTGRQARQILVVDDDRDICRNLSDIFSDLGYQVDCAHDGQSALELVRQRPYEVALLDLKMPGMDGLTLYREIRKLRAQTVSLLVTAYGTSATEEQALAAGTWKVLAKPVEIPKLLGLVEEALGQPLVLIADDDRDLCHNLWELFRERGLRVSMAHDCREATEQLKQSKFHVVLIDMRFPDSGGSEVFRLVRAANPRARTVLITGHRSELDNLLERLRQEGADAVCYKPFNIPELLGTVERLSHPHEEGAALSSE
jgi:two-component system, NtrC family, response regulator HydG